MAEQVQSFNFKFDNPTPDLVTMRAGRHGEWNEYVEFQPYNSVVVYVAQLCQYITNVYEVHPGKKGSVKTLATGYSAPIAAIEHAYKEALAVAQG